MNVATKIKELTQYPHEEEWFEFKENWFNADEVGEYISALANSAVLIGKKKTYIVWGVHDKTHKITGTTFDPINLFDLINANPKLSYEEYGNKLGVSAATVKRKLSELLETGKIIRKRSNKTGW